MRLIDADELIEVLHESLEGDCDLRKDYEFMGIDEFIKIQPTAYDIDGVVEQLKRCYGIVRSTSVDYAEGLKDAYERAIGIVKGGGIDGR